MSTSRSNNTNTMPMSAETTHAEAEAEWATVTNKKKQKQIARRADDSKMDANRVENTRGQVITPTLRLNHDLLITCTIPHRHRGARFRMPMYMRMNGSRTCSAYRRLRRRLDHTIGGWPKLRTEGNKGKHFRTRHGERAQPNQSQCRFVDRVVNHFAEIVALGLVELENIGFNSRHQLFKVDIRVPAAAFLDPGTRMTDLCLAVELDGHVRSFWWQIKHERGFEGKRGTIVYVAPWTIKGQELLEKNV